MILAIASCLLGVTGLAVIAVICFTTGGPSAVDDAVLAAIADGANGVSDIARYTCIAPAAVTESLNRQSLPSHLPQPRTEQARHIRSVP